MSLLIIAAPRAFAVVFFFITLPLFCCCHYDYAASFLFSLMPDMLLLFSRYA